MNVRSHKANPERCQRHRGCLEAGPPGTGFRKPGRAAGGRGLRSEARARAPLYPFSAPRHPRGRGVRSRGRMAAWVVDGRERSGSGCGRIRRGGAGSERAAPTATKGPLLLCRSYPVSRASLSARTPPTDSRKVFCGPRSAVRLEERAERRGRVPFGIWTKQPHSTRRGRARGAGGEPEPACPCQRRGTIFARRIPHPPEDPADVGRASKRHDRSCAMSPLCRRTRAGRGAARAITGRDGALSDFSAMAGSNRPCRKATGEVP
jgi:hypothetical protein